MGLLDSLNGVSQKIDKAERMFLNGNYSEALDAMDFSDLQVMIMSKEQFCQSMYLSAECFIELGDKNAAIKSLERIINYPDYNNTYISKAEALKKEIQG